VHEAPDRHRHEGWKHLAECLGLRAPVPQQIGLSPLNRDDGAVRSLSRKRRKDHGSRASPRKFDAIELDNVGKVVAEIDQSKLDSIFSMSIGLDNYGIIDFICNICKVSRDELADEHNPGTFSLQKLVEVADLNMSRITYVWFVLLSATPLGTRSGKTCPSTSPRPVTIPTARSPASSSTR
jgi:hypothetical protein